MEVVATYIDINCDVGEGMGNEARLFPFISSCNIACGGHAGDMESMRSIARLARENGIRVGAHPSYPDTENFGRVAMKISDEELKKALESQLEIFCEILYAEHIRLHHIKPHGELYNVIAKNSHLASLFLDVVERYRAEAILFVPPSSKIAVEADRRGFRIKYEAFADRNYNEDLSLVPRKFSNAVISEPHKVAEHLLMMVKNGAVRTVNGKEVPIKADTFCIHGDTPSAFEILAYLSKELPWQHVHLKK
ncbi:5-oxoprolinase subunit PxpA [Flagellimonas lutaonensis]|uniref:LamB/YcsF family protein n=1 Tax=Flagellimonas lutaonensis TaxID=516051 RepID=A0A0D5YX94_9FLAO|nr:5-oxoprolinase subunit PxpA [Allomuricauda lutaonensis]AKA36473.1 LamB/YcsF family protein [Allomuricauda lutaonensis]